MLLPSARAARPGLVVEVVPVVPAVGSLVALHLVAGAAALSKAGGDRGVHPIVQLAALGILGTFGTVQGAVVKGRAGRDGAVAADGERLERATAAIIAALLRRRKGLRMVYLPISVLLGLQVRRETMKD